MSSRKLKRKMIRELGIEKHSDIVRRKLKGTSESSRNIRNRRNGKESDPKA